MSYTENEIKEFMCTIHWSFRIFWPKKYREFVAIKVDEMVSEAGDAYPKWAR